MWSTFLLQLVKSFHSPLFITLISLIIIDVICGCIVAVMQKSGHSLHGSVESSHFIKGIWRKILNILIFFIGAVLSFATKQTAVENFAGYAVVAYEGISIIENFALMGVPFPKQLKKIFDVFKSKSGDENDD